MIPTFLADHAGVKATDSARGRVRGFFFNCRILET